MQRSHTAPATLVLLLAASLAIAQLSGCGSKTSSSASASATADKRTASTKTKPGSATATSLSLEPPSYSGFEPLPCLTYHHVDPKMTNDIALTPAAFEAQLKALRDSGYHAITARDLASHHASGAPLPDKPLMITFDDGWKNQYVYAAPLLQKYGFRATFFINPRMIDRGNAYMTTPMITSLAGAGNDIESHTWMHLGLTRSSTETAAGFAGRAKPQLTQANQWIKRVTGQAPVALCYPFGNYDVETIGLAQRSGYVLGFTTDEGVADARAWDRMAMKRFTVTRGDSIARLQSRLSSRPLPVTGIQPAPASRVVGREATVTVDITGVPASVTGIALSSGPGMGPTTIVSRGGHRYAIARIRHAKAAFRQVTIRGHDSAGARYYSSWGLVMGD